MELTHTIANALSDLQLFTQSQEPAELQITEFEQRWKALGRQILEESLQQTVEAIEHGRSHCRRKRKHHYHTPLGSIVLTRRIYDGDDGPMCWADQTLMLPSNGWFTCVQELACGLGVSSEFPNATRLFTRWSGVNLSEKSLANQVEACGEEMELLDTEGPDCVNTISSSLSQAACPDQRKPVVFVGSDGIMTPMKGPQLACEAKVGVVFWQSEHWKVSKQRSWIRQREYVATLEGAQAFSEQLNRRYAQVVGKQPHQVVFLGDGALWIWAMVELLFPNAIEILDFYHVMEYVWQVARQAFPNQHEQQQQWVNVQKLRLKQSQWQSVLTQVQRLPPSTPELEAAVNALTSYLWNNQSRLDYKRYRELGLMIGSGVVESSNRRVVTQRLKHSGMFWSKRGAQAVMTLRATYLSDSNRWDNFWHPDLAG